MTIIFASVILFIKLLYAVLRIDSWNHRKGLARLKSTGIIRKVDELGRVVLPAEIRRMLDIAERDELEIYMDNDQIVLKKFEPSCVFCSSSSGLVRYRGKNVCQNCAKEISTY